MEGAALNAVYKLIQDEGLSGLASETRLFKNEDDGEVDEPSRKRQRRDGPQQMRQLQQFPRTKLLHTTYAVGAKATLESLGRAAEAELPAPFPQTDFDDDEFGARKRSSGLRHFSLKVCEKVEEKKRTTYNEVAECLVKELAGSGGAGMAGIKMSKKSFDEKNIRRRVYDALNVLEAMGIITKDRKQIMWIGLPGGVHKDIRDLSKRKDVVAERLAKKRELLSNLLQETVCFRNLIRRNEASAARGPPAVAKLEGAGSSTATATNAHNTGNGSKEPSPRLFLPFVLVSASHSSGSGAEPVIQCEMNEERNDVNFTFSDPFTIQSDTEVMKKMELSHVSSYDLARYIPQELANFYPKDKIGTL